MQTATPAMRWPANRALSLTFSFLLDGGQVVGVGVGVVGVAAGVRGAGQDAGGVSRTVDGDAGLCRERRGAPGEERGGGEMEEESVTIVKEE